MASKEISVVGAGLAGSECAWQLAERGHNVALYEMRGSPQGYKTPAHLTQNFAELVCSNSFGSQTDYSASGQLKWEAERMNSFILKVAREFSVPAGMALGIDREKFSAAVTQALQSHPRIRVVREIVNSIDDVPRPTVIATGPLTSASLAESIQKHLAEAYDAPGTIDPKQKDFLYFFDAIAPIVDVDTINMDIAWKANRYDQAAGEHAQADVNQTEGHYINCPLSKDQYFAFIEAVAKARKVEAKDFEKDTPYFDACMPIEAILERGPMTLRFGPMSPKGLINPRTGKKEFAIVQLRQENKEGTAYNMVGFQTKMAYGDQKEVFRMIPGLENAEFLKLGSIHRNLYIHSPRKLTPSLSSKTDPWLFFAGQMTGVEGYFDSTCIGHLVARFVHDQISRGEPPIFNENGIHYGGYFNPPPRESAHGSLLNAITEAKVQFQPTNINFGLFPLLGMHIKTNEERKVKREIQLERAKTALTKWLEQ